MATFDEQLRQWQQQPWQPRSRPSSPPAPPHQSLSSSIVSLGATDDAAGSSSDHGNADNRLEPIRSNVGKPASEFQCGFEDADAPPPQETPPPTGVGKLRWEAARFWRNHISMVVPGAAARDHLALERTYLSYHRTALALALLSVLVVQLQVLQHSPNPDPVFGFYAIGKPLAACLAVGAMATSMLGWLRWWRWQQTLIRGKALAGGWELTVTVATGFSFVLAFLVLSAVVSIRKTNFTQRGA